MDQKQMKNTAVRLSEIRSELLKKQPFLGRILMRLPFGFAPCGTAYTDMKKIVFDPSFAERLSKRELEFVLLHEVMHCVLKHCIRSRGYLNILYNIASDIVVNSTIFDAMGIDSIDIDGTPAMHLAPNGREGREYSAEQIYKMLLSKDPEDLAKIYGESSFDSHEIWEKILSDNLLEDIWNRNIASAAKGAGIGSGIPAGIRRMVKDISDSPKIDWRQILHDFIKHNKSDYSFMHPDKRYSDSDFLMPSFVDDFCGGEVENLWFLVDTSGSIDDKTLSFAMGEIRSAIEQFESLMGCISFFDSEVSDPVEFEDPEGFGKIQPIGGGGTSFSAIFDAMKVFFKDKLPRAVIILTDGYSFFPPEEAAMNVPVFWLIIDSDVKPPFGEYAKITVK